MPESPAKGESSSYEPVALEFLSARSSNIGVEVVRKWSHTVPAGGSILDLGCGHGVPISQLLIQEGFRVFGIETSPTLAAEFRRRFPESPVECAPVESSAFFHRKFDAVVAWGLMFLLPANVQPKLIAKVSHALDPGGNFLFTAPVESVIWQDELSGRESISLGATRYKQVLHSEQLILIGEEDDESGNHYYFARKH